MKKRQQLSPGGAWGLVAVFVAGGAIVAMASMPSSADHVVKQAKEAGFIVPEPVKYVNGGILVKVDERCNGVYFGATGVGPAQIEVRDVGGNVTVSLRNPIAAQAKEEVKLKGC